MLDTLNSTTFEWHFSSVSIIKNIWTLEKYKNSLTEIFQIAQRIFARPVFSLKHGPDYNNT